MQEAYTRIRFSYDFVRPGSKVVDDKEANKFHIEVNGNRHSYDRTSTVILDVGNLLTSGVIDIHQMKNGFKWNDEHIVSTTKLLTYFPSFLNHLSMQDEDIKIIMHTNPDFDCFASVYLVQYFLEHGEFPKYAHKLAEYAELIDSGRMKLNPDYIFTPYSITLVLSETLKSRQFLSFASYQEAYLHKGIELMTYIMMRLPALSNSEREIESPVLFESNHPFQSEQAWIEADYKKYSDDLVSICEKRKMRLPCLKGSTVEVDGLFWNEPSTCALDRLWARSDRSSPSGTGYVFTFVPKVIHEVPVEIMDRFKDVPIQLDRIRTTNQVIISVDGNEEVTLVNLGRLLEFEENRKENILLGESLKEKWRSRQPENRRFYEDWADNSDPWYDGRNNQYQIVDAPKIGSLMTIKEIKQVVINYTKPKVLKFHTRILFPFQFEKNNFPQLLHALQDHPHYTKCKQHVNKEISQYFRPYIQEYLFNSNKGNQGYSYTFTHATTQKLSISVEDGNISTAVFLNGTEKETTNDLVLEIGNITLSLFRYGVGFIVVDTHIDSEKYKGNLLFDLVLDLNKDLCEGKCSQKIVSFNKKLLGEEVQSYIQDYEDGIMYTDVTLSDAAYFEKAKSELLDKLCSQTKWDSHVRTNQLLVGEIDNMYEHVNECMIIGFSKKGSVLLTYEKNTELLSPLQRNEYQYEIQEARTKFQNWYYYIFLLVLHQRYGLMNFSKELSEVDIKNNHGKVATLRDGLFEFIVQSWFSQVTNDERGMVIHKKWMNVFETQILHDEVLQQVSTIADHQNAKKDAAFSIKFNIVSFLFLIISGITGFFGMNIPFISTITNNMSVWYSVSVFFIVATFWLMISGVLWINKKMKG